MSEVDMPSAAARELRSKLSAVVVGQTEAISAVVTALVRYKANLNDRGKPIAAFLLLGPTGSGKTLLAEAVAEALHGTRKAVMKLHCAELSSEHELARLKGSPPGYVGWKECVALLSQTRLKEACVNEDEPAIVLFDEVEKAHSALWELLLGLLDKGEVVLNDNTRVNFSQAMILFTGNVGSKEVEQNLSGGMGFAGGGEVKHGVVKAAERIFAPEFRNRLTSILVFHPLNREQACEVARRELARTVRRAATQAELQLAVSESVVEAVVTEGWEPRYGARGIKRAIEKLLIDPLSNLVMDKAVSGNVVVKAGTSGLTFEQAMAV